MKRFKDILCVVETGKACEPALERAVTLANNNQANLTVVEVIDRATARLGMSDGGPVSGHLQAAMASAHTQTLEALVAPYRKRIEIQTKPQAHLVKGGARKEIPALAERIGADLIVMGTVARTGIPGFIVGNAAETILNQIGCSVLAIKPPGFETPVTLQG